MTPVQDWIAAADARLAPAATHPAACACMLCFDLARWRVMSQEQKEYWARRNLDPKREQRLAAMYGC